MDQAAIDNTDLLILRQLIGNSALTHKEIGQEVHLTGQAVGARIRRLQDLGVITGYSVNWDPEKLGLHVHALVTVFLNSGNQHKPFLEFLQEETEIEEAYRVSGEGCYWMRVRTDHPDKLNTLLDRLLKHGNYKISLSIGRVK
ncbi:Lrp/AsnC family transcriptional regulator [Paenibacillus sp. HN-1]|uniref:Lrp/AsnC family transcriptional regulator n=1 Tax=Paenibacillus TaxID=44249 RepID=UPI001CA7E396|nr:MULTISPECIES: Lrp/AsnC family transcriptional regulator [Paenibacillus]MBY9081078.1 Lrp/AsnC family transcriptional regulator [Paenibacillus sp. CGMCC 1.18879]MBY9087115.1 Lrp/AsnC family transcriptional regulator [Paenibacillus sinensis]